MLIKYTPKQDHMLRVQLIPTTDELKKLKLARKYVELLPGTNEVTDDEWAVMKPHLQSQITAKVIETIDNGKTHNLKGLSPQKATELVAKCVNPDTLKKWYQEITDQEVRLAIVERMKELKIDVPKFTGTNDKSSDSDKPAPNAGDGKSK
jgi:hypothetical protein